MPATTTISKLLVANRGEIARRIFRTCGEMGIATVAVHSDADADAPFVREADEAVPLGGTSAGESYLRVDAIISAARRAGADAVHPGYGFLAENPELARACEDAGIAFVGPSAEAIAAMGSKVRARGLMEQAGVPVLPAAEIDGGGLEAGGERLGFPLLAKASAGGGGKGMRVVHGASELRDAVEAARREAESAFGDGTIFLERYLERPRHVEIQVIADTHGTTVSLGERECSIQRRHQKIIEESPSPAVDQELRKQMGEAAVRAAQAVGYVGAGTVEFLLAGDEFFFLEMNTRLQVEHAVTELVTGLDLVRLQLLCARGEPLPSEAREPGLNGHAIEARLYAEDPRREFLPQTGTVERFHLGGRGLRVDAGVEDGSEVSIHYDPMLAKVLAWAPSRTEAAERLAAGLAAGEIHGLVTNRDFLVRVLRHAQFLAGETDTAFLERHDPVELGAPLAGPDAERLHAAAAALAAQAERRARAALLGHVPSGWRSNPSQRQHVDLEGPDGEVARVEYQLDRGGLELLVDGEPLPSVRLREASAELVDLEVEGVRRWYRVARTGEMHHVNSALGQTSFRETPRFPIAAEAVGEGALVAPMPGTVVKVGAAEGETVAEGAVLVVLEAMKMEHELAAPADGALTELRVQPGDQVEPGAVLAVVEPPG